MDGGHPKEALEKFQAAYTIVPSPKVLFNMGLAHQALGDTVAALECFEGFLGELPDAPEDARAYAERQIVLLRSNVSFVDISGDLPGAEVRVDDRPVGVLPLRKSIVVEPGARTVTIVAAGREAFRQQIMAVAGRQTRVFAVVPVVHTEVAHRRGWARTAFWIAAGLSGVALAGGITGHVLYESKSSDYRDLLGRGGCDVGASQRSHCEELRSDAGAARTLAWIGYSTAAVSAGAAITFWLLQPKASSPAPNAHAHVVCGPSAALVGVSCFGNY